MCSNNEYRCKKCGSSKLAYKKYVRCKTPIEIQEDGTFVYLASIINEDDYIFAEFGFCCADCDEAIVFKTDLVQSEAELKYMLNLPEEERERLNDEYLSMACDYADYLEELRADIEEAREFCEEY